jgi:serine phosphatase RsbU (regulator of sigma subunit)
MSLKFIVFIFSFFIVQLFYSQSKSKIILNRATELFNKNYNASFDLCCQAEKINDIKYTGEVSICKARYYITFTDYENAEFELTKAITFFTKRNDLKNLSHAFDLKSILLDRIGDTISSCNYLLKAYQLSKKSKDIPSQIKRLINLSHNFITYKEFSKADFYLTELEKFKDIAEKSDLYYYYQNKGSYYSELSLPEQAIPYYEKAFSIAHEYKMIDSEATILMLQSQAYRKINKLDLAEKKANLSYNFSKKYNLIYEKSEALAELILIKEINGKFKEAFTLQQEFIELEKEILNSEKLNRVSAIQNRLVLAEKENIITKQNSKIANEKIKNTETEIKNQKLYISLFIVLIVVVFIFLIYLKTKKINRLIEIKKNDAEFKNKLVESQNKDIKDSIRYAKRIQEAILPPDEHWFEKLPNSFVYYQPKDILSGDFYWIEETEDFIFAAAADCTGHGVPGALISIVNYNLLNKAVLEKHIYDPAKILDAVNNWLTESLHQSFQNSTVKDGMDVSLISINKKTNELKFSGAFNSIYIYRTNELHELKGDRFPVGTFIHEEKQYFKTHIFQLEKEDVIYLFTDGFADQFGGEKNKKFKYSQLKSTFLEIKDFPHKEQLSKLEHTFSSWQGKNEQVDDVLIIGITI